MEEFEEIQVPIRFTAFKENSLQVTTIQKTSFKAMTLELKRRLTAVLLIVGAIAAILLPFIAGTLVTLVIGGIAFSVGIGQLLQLGQENTQGKLFRILSALLYVGGAVFILIDPIEGEISLTLFAGVVMIVEGLMELATGAAADQPTSGLVVVDGLITALFGLLLVLEWPSDSIWAIGTLFGAALSLSAIKLLNQPAVAES